MSRRTMSRRTTDNAVKCRNRQLVGCTAALWLVNLPVNTGGERRWAVILHIIVDNRARKFCRSILSFHKKVVEILVEKRYSIT